MILALFPLVNVWNIASLSHNWKNAGSRADTISILKILFLAVVTGGAEYNNNLNTTGEKIGTAEF